MQTSISLHSLHLKLRREREYELRLNAKYLIGSHLKMRKKREESCFKCKDYLFVNLDLKLKKKSTWNCKSLLYWI